MLCCVICMCAVCCVLCVYFVRDMNVNTNIHYYSSYYYYSSFYSPSYNYNYYRYFLSADVLSYYDLEEMGSAYEAIRALKFRQQGTLYTVIESDIMDYKIKNLS
jgi:hypothetical protein